VASIREGILKVIHDSAYREQLIKAGSLNAERFGKENIARQYLACYQRIVTA